MKTKLSNEELASLCYELACLQHSAPINGTDLENMAKEGDPDGLLTSMGAQMNQIYEPGEEARNSLSAAMRDSGAFPTYASELVKVAEGTGNEAKTLDELSSYYASRARLNHRIRSALLYPAVMLVLMLVVIGVLLVKVLPIFDDVYASLGGRLTGVAGGLLTLGRWIDGVMPVLWVLLVVLVLFAGAFSLSDSFRSKVLSGWRRSYGDKGVSRVLNNAHVTQALAMVLATGDNEMLRLIPNLLDSEAAKVRCQKCLSRLDDQEGQPADLADALREGGFLSARQCRLLKVSTRSGTSYSLSGERDSLSPMKRISMELHQEAEDALDALMSRVEPALVLVCSVLVGLILLSVMLPLMHIMAAIG